MPLDFREFRRQSPRLLRQKWKSPESLSQELYAMMTTDPVGPGDSSSSEVKAGTPSYVLARMQKQIDEMTPQEAISDQPGRPGYIPPPPKIG